MVRGGLFKKKIEDIHLYRFSCILVDIFAYYGSFAPKRHVDSFCQEWHLCFCGGEYQGAECAETQGADHVTSEGRADSIRAEVRLMSAGANVLQK